MGLRNRNRDLMKWLASLPSPATQRFEAGLPVPLPVPKVLQDIADDSANDLEIVAVDNVAGTITIRQRKP
jgi:hypothetical protein